MGIYFLKKIQKGAHVPHMKNTEDMPFIKLDKFSEIKIPMRQHMGSVCKPLVKTGDYVKLGQKIGDSESNFSAPIHASCSGTVKKIDNIKTVSGEMIETIVIENDQKYEISEEVKVPQINNKEDFIKAIRESGIVGLGGAGFPTHVKLDYKGDSKIEKLVVNCAECEPYITSDYRECIEYTDNILYGIECVKKYLGISKVYFGIESNKPKAIKLFSEKTKEDDNFMVIPLKSLYPQGAEKTIIYATTGIVVESGKLPADCGVLVMNVSTLGFIGNYLKTGIPLVERKITVDGDAINKPNNLIVPIGAPINEILDYCECKNDLVKKVLMGGPMMGISVADITTPVIKNNNAILAFTEKMCKKEEVSSCIKCGKCISVCPMNLMPAGLEKAYDKKDFEKLNDLAINLCINCGCCSYICPANRPLAQKNQLAKTLLRNKNK